MGYSPWGHKESDTAEPVIALHSISMHGVKTSMSLVQQSCEAVVLLPEERQTCVLQGVTLFLSMNSKFSGHNRSPVMRTLQKAAQCCSLAKEPSGDS